MNLFFNDINGLLQACKQEISKEKFDIVLNKIENYVPLTDKDVGYLLYAPDEFQEIIIGLFLTHHLVPAE